MTIGHGRSGYFSATGQAGTTGNGVPAPENGAPRPPEATPAPPLAKLTARDNMLNWLPILGPFGGQPASSLAPENCFHEETSG
jgi:hypothetical protein